MTGIADVDENPSAVARELADEARVALGRVRAAWPQLAAARLPGSRSPVVDRPADRRGADRAAEEWRQDRAAALEASRNRRVISGHHPAPGNLDPIEARHTIARDLSELTSRLWNATYAGGLVLMIHDPASGDRTLWCTWCQGTGEAQPPYGWVGEWPKPRLIPPAQGIGPWYLEPPIPCSRCREGRIAVADGCQACAARGPCGCDRADIATHVSMATIGDLLDLLDVETAADAEATLLDAAYLCDQTLRHKGPTRIRLHDAECPACGARELFAETASPDPREWAVRCQGDDCVCAGPAGVDPDGKPYPACPCGIATPRRSGRRHLWPSRVWDGRTGLAKRLGIELPGTRRHTGPRIPRRRKTDQKGTAA